VLLTASASIDALASVAGPVSPGYAPRYYGLFMPGCGANAGKAG